MLSFNFNIGIGLILSVSISDIEKKNIFLLWNLIILQVETGLLMSVVESQSPSGSDRCGVYVYSGSIYATY